MFSKVFLLSIISILAISSQVNAHCAITPMLGVTKTPVRADVQRPSTSKPCGSVDVASTVDTSTPVQAASDGTFSVNATDFNAGADGSRSVSAKVDPTAAGKTFSTAVTISQNGNANPSKVGTDKIVASLPAGTTCSGGASGNLCLVQFTTTAGFGNCVVVAQGTTASAATTTVTNGTAAATTTATNGTTADTPTSTANGTTTSTTSMNGTTADASSGTTNCTTTTTTTNAHHKHKHAHAAAVAAGNVTKADVATAQAGTRAARALLFDLETRGEEALSVVKRGVFTWMWA